MKIPASIRRLYEDQFTINTRLKDTIDARMTGLKNRRWHYESRLKDLPSFALKIESGRFKNPEALEDFFACMLVVVNTAEIAQAEALVHEHLTVRTRRPSDAARTHKSSEAFPFDDLRLYVTLKEEPAVPPTDLFGVLFEVQIKTFLQHAWAIATHDLLYKTDDANWSKERIAYQVRAMLEHAEVSIQEAESLAACDILAKQDPRTEMIRQGIKLLRSQWIADQLPSDLRRLAININVIREALSLKPLELEEILNKGRSGRGGVHPSNLSPYATVLQYLFDVEPTKMRAFLSDKKSDRRILLAEEVELPPQIDRKSIRNAVVVGVDRA